MIFYLKIIIKYYSMFKSLYIPEIDKVENLIPKILINGIDDTIDDIIDSFKIKTLSSIKFQKPNISIINGFRNFLLEKKVLNNNDYINFEEFYDREIWKLSEYLKEFLATNFSELIVFLEDFYGKDLITSPFKSLEIFEEIINSFIIKYQVEISYKEYKITFNIFYNPNDINNKIITDFLSIFLKGIIVLVYLSRKYNRKKEIKVFLIPTNFQKKIYSGDFIGPRSINSGFCVNSEIPIIYIFRNEEKDKVLIHEIIHALGFDSHNLEIDNSVKNIFGLRDDSVNLVSEAWVDYWAIIFNCIINAYLIGDDPNKLLMIEREYSIKQAYEILKKLDYNLQQLVKLEDISKEKFTSSSAISYYIIKAGLLMDNLVFKVDINNNILDILYIKEVLRKIIGKIIKEKLVLDRIIGGLRENDLRMTYIDIYYCGNDNL